MAIATASIAPTSAMTDCAWDWFLDDGLIPFAAEFGLEPGDVVDPGELAGWAFDHIRDHGSRSVGPILRVACGLADWDEIARRATAELAGEDDESSDDEF